ncbi:MAG TPA: DNA-processing protein DprA [Rubricoccaceae bacterium]|nr:DNA-processing protein DprA [Rubricoccaceae bacterium]
MFEPDPIPTADPSDPEEQRALVALTLVPGLGPARTRALLARFGSAVAVRRASARQLAAVEGIGPQTAAALASFDGEEEVERLFKKADAVGADLLTLHDPRYPALLRQIYDPPVVLWVRGALRPEDARAVAVVGTRKATEYGRRAAEHFASGLAEREITVVSGLAYGIDVVAHRAALDAGGRTLAVLGSGVDRIYPSAHAPLIRRMLGNGQGAVLSEFPPGTPPDAINFPRRNRIVAGLSLGTLVVEARATGGALLTALAAAAYDREVFAVPAPLFSEMEGTNQLVRKGAAALVTSVEEVLEELEGTLGATTTRQATATPPTDLSSAERTLYEALSAEPVALDTLCANTNTDPATALVYLLELEFKGLVRQMAGKQFYRA